MDLDRIKAFIDAMADSDLAEMTFREGDWTLRLTRAGDGALATVPTASPTPPAPAVQPQRPRPAAAPEIRAPMPGIVYLRPAPGEPDFVAPGASIVPGAVLCVVEAMKIFLQIRAECAGVVEAVLVASGDEVELGQALMRVG